MKQSPDNGIVAWLTKITHSTGLLISSAVGLNFKEQLGEYGTEQLFNFFWFRMMLVWEIDRELRLNFQDTKLSFFLLKVETIDGIERCNPLSSCYVEYVSTSYQLHTMILLQTTLRGGMGGESQYRLHL